MDGKAIEMKMEQHTLEVNKNRDDCIEITRLNAICPYFTMFPLTFPIEILKNYSHKGQWVLDPFCGRGTTNFAGRIMGNPSIGIDSNPVAVFLTKAKLVNTTPNEIVCLAKDILSSNNEPAMPSGEFWEYAFNKDVLIGICKIREALLQKCDNSTEVALKAIMMGALHGPQSPRNPSYFSNQSPRTYSPKPGYSVRYWKEKKLLPASCNIIDIIKRRAERFYGQPLPDIKGDVVEGDCTTDTVFESVKSVLRSHKARVSVIITSPPYYGMKTYIPDQWLRNWFLGGPEMVNYSTQNQIKHSGKDIFIQELKSVWNSVSQVSYPKAILAIRFGAINNRKVDPEEIIRGSLDETPWKIKEIKNAGVPKKGRRQADTFISNSKEPIREIDVIAINQ